MKNIYSKILSLSLLTLISSFSYGQLVGTSGYMIGDLVEVGIDARGYEGAPSLAGSHERGFAGLGFVANPAADGWVQYDGDFFLPGSPENGFGIEVAGVTYGNNRVGLYQIPGGIDSYTVTGDCIKIAWSGAAGGVDVAVTYSLTTTELYYNTQVILTNTTAGTLTDVYYYRNFDPDNNQTIGGGFATQNTIEAQPSPACEKALVSATQATPHASYVGIGAIGPDYRVTYGGFANRDASNIWNGTGFTSAVGASAAGDVAISLAHRTYTLAPGESDTLQFTIILNAADIDAAISSLYFFDYEGASGIIDECNPVIDTAWTCAGQPTTISVDGPGVGSFTWSWSPTTALSTSVGATTDASPTATTLYTVTGTPTAACVATTISKDIVVDIWPAPDVSITDPGPQCGDFDLSTLVVTDLNATPGVTMEFFSVIPDSSDQTVGIWPSGTMSSGDVVYVMMANPVTGCFDVEPVIIDFSGGATAGPDNTATLCNTPGSTVDCNTLLVGADPGGFWEETTVPASGGFTAGSGVFDANGIAGGTYTVHYVATAIAPCTNDTAVITITVNPTPIAGPDNTSSLCNTAGTTLDLNTLLVGADAGGTWTETSAPASGAFTPATGVLNASGVAPGLYTFNYTVNGIAPCGNDIATMSITIEQEVNAGADNAVSLCNTAGSAIDLNTMLVGADAGGTWVETSGTPSGGFTPGTGVLNASGVTAGTYTFTYTLTAVAPCTDDFATMTITIEDEVNAGADNTASLCNSAGTTLDLNTLLAGADAGGTWVETSGTPSGGFTAASGMLDASGVTAGTYTFDYNVTGVAPCLSDVASFTITIEQEVVAGPDNSATMCNSAGSTLDLNTLLTGADAGGTWSETTAPASGTFTPATGMFDASGLTAGSYTFNYDLVAVAPCMNDVATISISVTDLPNAGGDNTASLCNSAGTTLDLSTLLVGADPGGTWTETTTSGAFTAGTSTLDASGLAAGVYSFTYDIFAVGPCPGDQSLFDVTVEQEANAGADNTDALCNYVGTTLDMNTLLAGADAGGTWAETTGSGSFTPGTGVFDASSLAAATYSFTYTVAAVAPCMNDVSNFDVAVEQAMTAGADNAYISCNNPGASIDLNTLLTGADAGGTWVHAAPAGSVSPGMVFDMTGVAGGTYAFDYTVNPVAPCPIDMATISVTVNETPVMDPVTDLQVCADDNLVVPAFTSDVAGTSFDWSNLTGTDIGFGLMGTGNIASFTAINPGSTSIIVTVEVTPTSPAMCVGNTESFDITVSPRPTINFSADTLVGCEPLQVNFTNSSAPGGDDCVWTFGDGSTASGCGGTSHIYNNAGAYDVGLTVTTAEGCTNSALYTDYINVSLVPQAFFSYSPGVITIESPEVEFTNSSINADSYTWWFGDQTASSSEINPTHLYPTVGGQYTVTLIAESDGGCVDSITQVIIVQDVMIFYVPNSFTPDGDDYNQTFKPVITAGVDIYDYHLTIFNRWGEILFESFNVENGWDGTYGDRGLVDNDVFVWQIEFGETMSDKNHRYRGHVTVLK